MAMFYGFMYVSNSYIRTCSYFCRLVETNALRTVVFACTFFCYAGSCFPTLYASEYSYCLRKGLLCFSSAPRAEVIDVMKVRCCIFSPSCLNTLDLHAKSNKMMAFKRYKGVSKNCQRLCSSTGCYTTPQQDPGV